MTRTKQDTVARVIATALLALGAAMCSATPPTAPPFSVQKLSVQLTQPWVYVTSNEELMFQAYAVDGRGTYTNVTAEASWTSPGGFVAQKTFLNRRVASLIPGRVGEVRVSAMHMGVTDTVVVVVSPFPRPRPYFEVTVNDGFLLTFGSTTDRLNVRTFHSNLGNVDAVVTSSDPSVAVVEGNRVRPVSPGTFRLNSEYNGLSASTLLSVVPPGAPGAAP